MDITVLVAIFNPDINKLLFTLYSILIQKGVRFEVIICDDGSEIDFSERIIRYFADFHFNDFKIVRSKENMGTIRNLLNGSQYANSQIIKSISPGDYFSDESALKEYYEAFHLNNADVVFSASQYYSFSNGLKLLNIQSPQLVKCYQKNYSQKKIVRNLVLNNDFISGAATAYRLEVFTQYLNELSENNVIYAEDLSTLLLAVDGHKFAYVPKELIWYEYGTGISSNKNSAVRNLVARDQYYLYINCLEKRKSNKLVRRCVKFYRSYGKSDNGFFKKFMRSIFFPEKILFRIKILFLRRKTTLDEKDFYRMIGKIENDEKNC